jgi:hypothetical protein
MADLQNEFLAYFDEVCGSEMKAPNKQTMNKGLAMFFKTGIVNRRKVYYTKILPQ